MRKRIFLFFLSVCFNTLLFASGKKTEKLIAFIPARDTIKESDKASRILRSLKNGSLIVRLKLNQKSIAAYRKSGRPELAEKLEEERKKLNMNMQKAFKDYFSFCKVFFIYSNETDEFLAGRRNIFLNAKLEHDSTIVMKDSFFIFCEYGSAEAYSKFDDNPEYFETNAVAPTGGKNPTSTQVGTQSALVMYDKDLTQLERPFPYAEGVYLENFGAAVRTFEREIERAYYRLVVNRDMKESMKKMEQKMKENK